MLKKFIMVIVNWAFKIILKYGILQFARLLLVILLPLFIASFFKKDLLPLCVIISLFCVFLGFLLIYL